MLIQPSQADVRRFFCGVYAKSRAGQAMEAVELLLSQWIEEHPEFHAELADLDAALMSMGQVRTGQETPSCICPCTSPSASNAASTNRGAYARRWSY